MAVFGSEPMNSAFSSSAGYETIPYPGNLTPNGKSEKGDNKTPANPSQNGQSGGGGPAQLLAKAADNKGKQEVETIPVSIEPRGVGERLKNEIFGQDQMFDAMDDAIYAHFSKGPVQGKPLIFLQLGPAGAGKSATAPAIAKSLYDNEKAFAVFDVAEKAPISTRAPSSTSSDRPLGMRVPTSPPSSKRRWSGCPTAVSWISVKIRISPRKPESSF